jgi:two-component system chemotaxis response regulator CheB
LYTILILDDSETFQNFLISTIKSNSEYKVISAYDPYEARDKIKQYNPDLVTVDINMPKMDGISFIKNLLRLHPMPILVISSNTTQQDSVLLNKNNIPTLKKQRDEETIDEFKQRILRKIKLLEFNMKRYKNSNHKEIDTQYKKYVKVMPNNTGEGGAVEMKHHPDEILKSRPNPNKNQKLIAIGSSTGGVEALANIFSKLPSGLPPILITQHIPQGFSTSLANRLNNISDVTVYEAQDGMIINNSSAYLAPGNMHLTIYKTDNNIYKIQLIDDIKISRHKPSVDIMFRSVNNEIGGSAMGIILTGMGDDGVIGLKDMYFNSAYTIAQDEDSCVVFGMPARAIEANIISNIVSLDDIANEIIFYAKMKK